MVTSSSPKNRKICKQPQKVDASLRSVLLTLHSFTIRTDISIVNLKRGVSVLIFDPQQLNRDCQHGQTELQDNAWPPGVTYPAPTYQSMILVCIIVIAAFFVHSRNMEE